MPCRAHLLLMQKLAGASQWINLAAANEGFAVRAHSSNSLIWSPMKLFNGVTAVAEKILPVRKSCNLKLFAKSLGKDCQNITSIY